MKIFRKPIFVIVFAGIGCLLAQVQSKPLQVARQGNRLVVSAPQLHFIVGKPLEQLHNGASVTYLFSVTLTGADPIRIRQRFVLSYDLWEEKFSVLQSDACRTLRVPSDSSGSRNLVPGKPVDSGAAIQVRQALCSEARVHCGSTRNH